MNRRWQWLGTLAIAAVEIGCGGCGSCGRDGVGKVASTVPPADFSGMWETVALERVVMPEANNPQYTDAARAMIAEYQSRFDANVDDPAQFCLLKGMPWTMLIRARNYPLEIYQTGQRVLMFFELYDTYRNIYLDRAGLPENMPPSANGNSWARWEGATLVVETGGLTEMHRIGQNHRSEDAHIVERWTLKQDAVVGQVIDVDITFSDPAIYTVPVKAHQVLKRSEPGTVVGGYNCTSTLWAEHIKQREAEMQRRGAGRVSKAGGSNK